MHIPIGISLINRRLFASIIVTALLSGCSIDVARSPANFQSSLSTIKKSAAADTTVASNSGYQKVIRKSQTWNQVGNVAQGMVFAPVNDVFSIEGAHTHEAYLVVASGNLVGFYLPAEHAFSPLSSNQSIKLWEE